MKKFNTLALIGASVLALSAGAAQAQSWGYDRGPSEVQYQPQSWRHDGWTSIDQRQAQLDRRIDMGVRSGALDRREAMRLRGEFRDIARLEARYRVNGLSGWERADLDRRFDRLSAQIRIQGNDNQYGYGYGHDHDDHGRDNDYRR